MNKVKINGKEYSSLSEGCIATGLSYDNARKFKQLKGSKFSMKLVKSYSIEIEEHGSDEITKKPICKEN
jgi:hypothetical protein